MQRFHRFIGGIELAAVDGIGALLTNQAGGHILHAPLAAHIAHAHHTCRCGAGKIVGFAIDGGGGIFGGAGGLIGAPGDRCRFTAQVHRIGGGCFHIVADHKAVVGGHGVVVAHHIAVVAADGARVAKGAGIIAGYLVAGADADAVAARGFSTGADCDGIGAAGCSFAADGHAIGGAHLALVADGHTIGRFAAGGCLITDGGREAAAGAGVFRVAGVGGECLAVIGVEELNALLVHVFNGGNHRIVNIFSLPLNIIGFQRQLAFRR